MKPSAMLKSALSLLPPETSRDLNSTAIALHALEVASFDLPVLADQRAVYVIHVKSRAVARSSYNVTSSIILRRGCF